MVSVGIVGAFIAGIFSLLSPCSALLLPAFFAYAFNSKRQLVARTGIFFVGLAAVLIPLGVGIGWFGQFLAEHRNNVILASGVLMIALGVYTFLGFGFNIPGLSKLNNHVRGSGWLAVLALGAVYGFAGFCAGPMLGAVLTTAMMSTSAFYGGLIMASYALGMTLPLFVLALLWEVQNLGEKQWLRGKTWRLGPIKLNTFSMLAGALFVLIGVLFAATHGTSGLPGLVSVNKQLEIQQTVLDAVSGASSPFLLLVALSVALIGALWLAYRRH